MKKSFLSVIEQRQTNHLIETNRIESIFLIKTSRTKL